MCVNSKKNNDWLVHRFTVEYKGSSLKNEELESLVLRFKRGLIVMAAVIGLMGTGFSAKVLADNFWAGHSNI